MCEIFFILISLIAAVISCINIWSQSGSTLSHWKFRDVFSFSSSSYKKSCLENEKFCRFSMCPGSASTLFSSCRLILFFTLSHKHCTTGIFYMWGKIEENSSSTECEIFHFLSSLRRHILFVNRSAIDRIILKKTQTQTKRVLPWALKYSVEHSIYLLY